MRKKQKVGYDYINNKVDKLWDEYKYMAQTPTVIQEMSVILTFMVPHNAYYRNGISVRRISHLQFYKSKKTGALDLDIVLDGKT